MKIDVKGIKQIESLALCKLSKIIISELPTTCVVSIERVIDSVD